MRIILFLIACGFVTSVMAFITCAGLWVFGSFVAPSSPDAALWAIIGLGVIATIASWIVLYRGLFVQTRKPGEVVSEIRNET